MARWQPGAAERLQRCALELFASRGFDQTTTADIAAAAGLTQRTFFRYFEDKRDVLFLGQDQYVGGFLGGVAAAPPGASPMELVAAALQGGSAVLDNARRPFSRLRQSVIDANPALQERERHKSAGLAVSIAAALRERGVAEPAATLAAESAATVFGVAFAQWLREDGPRTLADVVVEVLGALTTLTRAR